MLVSNVFISIFDLTVIVLFYPTTDSRVNPMYTPTQQQYTGWFIDTRFVQDLCLPVPIHDLDFQHHMSWSFLCSVSSVKMTGDCSFCLYWWH